MRFNHLVLGATLIATPSLALADGDAEPGTGEPALSPPVPEPELAIVGVPKEIGMRDLVLPASKAQVGGSFNIIHFSIDLGALGGKQSGTAEGLSVNAGYGITDKISAGLSYGLLLNDGNDTTAFSAKGPLDLFGSYAIMRKNKLTVVGGAGLTIAFANTIPAAPSVSTGTSTGDNTNLSLHLGASVRYEAAPKLSIFTGQPLAGLSMGDQLSIGFNNDQPIQLGAPVGVGYQITPDLWAYASTTLFSIYFTNGPLESNGTAAPSERHASFIFADGIPLSFGGYYSLSNKLDVGLQFTFPDVTGDYFLTIVGIGAQARL